MFEGIIFVERTVGVLPFGPEAQTGHRPGADIGVAAIGAALNGQRIEQCQSQRTLLQDDRGEIADFKMRFQVAKIVFLADFFLYSVSPTSFT